MKLHFEGLTDSNWSQFEKLFGQKGACGGCWCMTWRLRSSEYDRQKGIGNKRALREIVEDNQPTGILAFEHSVPVGWCSIAPRSTFVRLKNSRILKQVDDQPVWSLVCFYIVPGFRRRAISSELIKAAVDFAKSKGATIVEAYPVEPKKNPMPEVFAFTGIASAFFKLGFKEVARNSENRPIVRLTITSN